MDIFWFTNTSSNMQITIVQKWVLIAFHDIVSNAILISDALCFVQLLDFLTN